jgi:hypothetical protein
MPHHARLSSRTPSGALRTMALSSYRCAPIEAAAIRAEYLVSRQAIEEGLADEHRSALLRSFLPL